VRTSETDIEAYLVYLRQLPFVVDVRLLKTPPGGDRSVDAVLSIRTPNGTKGVSCLVRRSHLLRETAESLIYLARRVPDLLVLAPSVGRDLADLLEKEHVNFVDLAGNCHVRLGDQYIARIQGRTRLARPSSDKELRAASYRVLLALLIDRHLIDEPTRAIAVAAGGVSPQTVNDVRERLVARGMLLRSKAGVVWAPHQRREAIALFLAGLTTTLFPRLLVGRFRPMKQDVVVQERELPPLLNMIGPWRWGGGAACMRLTRYYRGDQTIVYFEQKPPAEVAPLLRVVPDRQGKLLLVTSPGPLAFRSPNIETVHPLLAYGDLLRESNDRAREAAQMIWEQFLRDLENDR